MSEFINKVWCPKCGFCSGDDWKQCQGACPMKDSPHYDPKVREAYGEPKSTPPRKRECVFYQGYEETCLRCNKKLGEHPPRDFPDLTDVVRVLKTFDEQVMLLAPKWEAADTEADVRYLLSQEEALTTMVRLAFWKATKDRNNWNHCRVVDVDFVRELCKSWLYQKEYDDGVHRLHPE